VFTINKLIFAISTMILLLIITIHNPTIAHAAAATNVTPTLEGQIKKFSEDLQISIAKMEQVNFNMTIRSVEIEQLTTEIRNLTGRISDRDLLIKKHLLSLKESEGSGTYLEVLLNAKSMTTLDSSETDSLKAILKQQDTEKIDLKNKIDMLDKKQTELAILQAESENLQIQLPMQQKQFDLLNSHLEKSKVVPIHKEEKENTYIRIVTTAGNQFIGKSTYVFGGGRTVRDIATGRFDCSGFVHWVFAQAGIELGNSTDSIKNSGRQISVKDMKPGDLVFFDTYKKDGHVGIYLGDGKFIGSQCSTGVAIEDMTIGYWKKTFNGHVERVI
jgi:cell wall-associated NlpC family hydrolase